VKIANTTINDTARQEGIAVQANGRTAITVHGIMPDSEYNDISLLLPGDVGGKTLNGILEERRYERFTAFEKVRALLRNLRECDTKIVWNFPYLSLSGSQMVGYNILFGPDFIPVGPDSSFELSGEFISVGTTPSTVYFGVDCCDKDKRSIPTCSFSYYPGTETKLINPCTSTDTAIIVEDASRWKPNRNGCIAFDIDDSGRDLPNYNTSSFGITAVRQLGERRWEIQLSGQIGKTYPADTKIREHLSTGGYVYCGIHGLTIPSDWTRYTGMVSSSSGGCRLYPFTKYIRIVILGNYHQSQSSILQFRNIRLNRL